MASDPWTLTDRQIALRRFICRLTDHHYDWHLTPPRCERCGTDEYWPVRATLGGWLERLRDAIRYRLMSVRRRLGRCPHCGGRCGCRSQDCIPF